jgi:poly(3-hydroxybutyrate) depolymerase
MFYQLYELNHAALQPARAFADAMHALYSNPLNPFSGTVWGRSVTATAELFERSTRHYGKPEFGLHTTKVDWATVDVAERVVWSRPFCRLLNFHRDLPAGRRPDPKLLIVAPMSGHYATLLRGTVETMLPHADVYITDWTDARMVPASDGCFDFDDYVDYVIDMLHTLGPDTHVMAVCQPSVPVLVAAAVMEQRGDPLAPASMTLMGGPIDTRRSPTAVNVLAEEKGLEWFRDNAIVKDDGDSAEKHRDFYDEYLAVMDLTAEFYLQTVDSVFISHSLPKGEMWHRGKLVDTGAIRNVALFTVEGENDDISGLGQTQAAHDLCVNLPDSKRAHYMQPRVGHYGVFNGSRFRAEIAPRIMDFIASNRQDAAAAKPRLVRSRPS